MKLSVIFGLTRKFYYLSLLTLFSQHVRGQTKNNHVSTHELFKDLNYPGIEFLEETKWHGFWHSKWVGYNFNHDEYKKDKLAPSSCIITDAGVLDCSAISPSDNIIEVIGNTDILKIVFDSFPKENSIQVLRLISLDGLNHIDNDAFDNVSKLKELVISGTKLEEVPRFHKPMQFMELIDLYDNNILKVSANTFKNCPNLKQVNLGKNLLTYIAPSAFTGTRTEYLTLHNNLFKYIPDLKGIETSLKYLGLEYNYIDVVGKYNLQGFSSLIHLNISYNPVDVFEHDCLQSLTNLQFLELISLSGNTQVPFNLFNGASKLLHVTLDHSNVLVFSGKSIEITPTLRGFSARYCEIKGLDFRSFEAENSLTRLWLDGNKLSTFQHSMFMHGNFENLEKLFLSDNNIHQIEWFGDDEFTSRTQIIKKHFEFLNITSFSFLPRLSVLNLDGNQIDGFRNNTFFSLPNLKELYISRNRLTNINIEASAFEGLKKLEILMFEDNNLNSVPFAVYSLKNLKKFNMKSNKLNFILSHDFTALTDLEVLNLANNKIILVENDAFPNSIEELYMPGNKFDFVDVEVFHSLSELKILSLSNNRITHLPRDIFAHNTNLESIYLNNNYLRFINITHFRNCKLTGDIHLQHNQLAYIDENSFQHVREAENFLLNNNELYQIPTEGMFQNMRVGDKIRIDNNKITHVKSKTFNGLSCRLFKINDNDITEIESYAFNEITITSTEQKLTTIFDVSNNPVISLHKHAFNKISVDKMAAFKNLKSLKAIPSFAFNEFSAHSILFSNNHVDIIESHGFNDVDIKFGLHLDNIEIKWIARKAIVGSVKQLYLNDNLITKIPSEALFHIRGNSELFLNNNQIEVIESNALPDTDDVIDLSNNKIALLTEHMFGKNENTKTLYLQFNDISRTENNIFPHMTGLIELDLSDNKLTEITDHLFSGLESVSILDLSNNRIRHFGAQNRMSSLETVNLSKNKIKQIDSTLFESGISLESLDLSDNSLSCGCGLFHTLEAIKDSVIGAVCSTPVQLIDTKLNVDEQDSPKYFLNIPHDNIVCEPVEVSVEKINQNSFKLFWSPPQSIEFKGITETIYCYNSDCPSTRISYDVICDNEIEADVFSVQDLQASLIEIIYDKSLPYFCSVEINVHSKEDIILCSSFSQVVGYRHSVPPIDDLTCQNEDNCFVLAAEYYKMSLDVHLFNAYGPREIIRSPQYKRHLLLDYLYKENFLDESDEFVNWYGPIKDKNVITKGVLTLTVKTTHGYLLYAENFYPVDDAFEQLSRDCSYNVRPLGFTAKLSVSIARTQSEVLKLGMIDEAWVYLGGKLLVELITYDNSQEKMCTEIRLLDEYAHVWIGAMSNSQCQVSNFGHIDFPYLTAKYR